MSMSVTPVPANVVGPSAVAPDHAVHPVTPSVADNVDDLDGQSKRCEKRFRKLSRQVARAKNNNGAARRAAERRWLGSRAVLVAAGCMANEKLPEPRRVALPQVFNSVKKLRLGSLIDEATG